MNKAHSPINWENYPSEKTPINESNLNKMDRTIGVIDDRVIELDNAKASKDEISSVISDVEYDEQGHALKFTLKNGDVKKISISNVIVDNVLSETSTNPVQNKVVTKEMNRLSEEIDKVIERKNLLKFIQANWTTSNILVSSKNDSSVMHIKADNLTLSSQQVFNVMLNNLIILEPNTTYTLSTSILNRISTQIRANNISLHRRDNYESVALIQSALLNATPNNKYITFTTPSDETEFYFTFTFASGAWDCDIDLNINLTKGSEPSYLEYEFIDLNENLQTIQEIYSKIERGYLYDIIVAKDGSGDYTTLTEAVVNANDFDVIFVKNGNYENEIVKAWGKTVFIIGQSKDGVVISNETGEYSTPPIEMGTGLLKNLTIYVKNNGTTTPTNKGYALHSESSVSNYNIFAIENCKIKSEWRSSWGLGMRGGTEYIITNTEFDGGVYLHDCEHSYRATKQTIRFVDCNITRDDSNAALILQDQQMTTATILIEFIRCLIKSANGSNVIYYKWNSTTSKNENANGLSDFPTWELSYKSWGNSLTDLNSN